MFEQKFEQRTISALISDICNDDIGIELNPPYQRDVIWNEDKKNYLLIPYLEVLFQLMLYLI